MARTLIPHKSKKSETDVSSFLDGVHCVVISYDPWISNTTQDIFSITSHYTRDNVREHAQIGMLITTSTDGESIKFPVSNVINQLSLGSELVGITSYDGTNLAICKDTLESTFDNTGVFDLGKPMFVMECHARVLVNTFKERLMYVQSDYGRVDTEVIRRNMQCCITWTKKTQNGAKVLETAQKHVVLPCKRLITPVKTCFYYLIHSF